MNRSLAIILLCLPVIAFAGKCPSQRSELSLYYGNGMFTSLIGQRQSQLKLMQLTRSQLPGFKVSYKLAINHNENPFDQLLEVTRQKLLQDYGIILLWLAGKENAPDWFRETLSDIVIQYQAFSYILDSDLQQHIRQYTQDIEQCQKVLLVAHSQGNFYGNEAWRWVYGKTVGDFPLRQLKVMGMVSVTTPASHVGESLSYLGDQQQITRYLTRDKLTSSALASAGYDSAANILEVEFLRSGSVYRYYGVPKPVFDGLMGAASAGGYYNQVIRGQYTSRKLH